MPAADQSSTSLPAHGRGTGRRSQYPEGERALRRIKRDETVPHHEKLAGAAEPVSASWHPRGQQVLSTGRERAMG